MSRTSRTSTDSTPTSRSTSSRASAAGPSPSSGRGGKGRSGPAPAPVSPTPWPEEAGGQMTLGTSGRGCSASSSSADLQWSLVSRLQARLDTDGSMEYRLTWREKATPARRSIFRLAASVPRTSASGCSGWRAPNAGDAEGGVTELREGTTARLKLRDQAPTVVGWVSTEQPGLEGHAGDGDDGREPRRVGAEPYRPAPEAGWESYDIVWCSEPRGLIPRRIEPGSFPMAYGVPPGLGRRGRLSGYGNAIVPPLAAAFVRAFVETGR